MPFTTIPVFFHPFYDKKKQINTSRTTNKQANFANDEELLAYSAVIAEFDSSLGLVDKAEASYI